MAMAIGSAHATSGTWQGALGAAWGAAGSWTNGVPGASDTGTFSGTGTKTADLNSSSFSIGGLVISNTGTTTIQGGSGASTLTINSGGISIAAGAGTVNLGGSGANAVTVDLGASQTWTNASTTTFTVANGVSGVAGSSTPVALTLAGSGSITLNGAIADSGIPGGTTALVDNNTGVVTLSAANTYTGGTTVNSGTLSLAFGATTSSNILASTSTVTLNNNGTTLAVTGAASTVDTQTLTAVNLASGETTISATSGTTGTLNLALGAINRTPGATVNIILPTAGAVTTTNTNSNGILGGYAVVNGGGWAASSSGTILALGSAGTGTYTTSVSAGTTPANYTNVNLDMTSSVTPTASITPNSIRFNTGAAETLTLTGTNAIASGGILVTASVGNNQSTITGGSLTSGNGTDLIVNQFDTSSKIVIGSTITDNSSTPIGLTVSGASSATSQLYLTGTNTYSGTTTINNAQLVIGNNSTTGSLGSGAIVDNGVLAYFRTNASTISNNISGTGTIQNSNNTGTVTFSGNLSGALTIGSIGTGGLILTGSNSFTGAIAPTGTNTLQFVANSGNTTNGVSTVFGNTSGVNMGGSNNLTIQLRSDSSATFTSANFTGNTGAPTYTFNVNNVNAVNGSGPQGNTLYLTGTYTGGSSTANDHSVTTNITGGNGYILSIGTVATEGSTTVLQTFNVASGVTLQVGTMVQDNNGKGHSIINLNGSGTTTIASLASIAGTRFDVDLSNGTLNLTGSNNFSNNGSSIVTVTSGQLNLGAAGALNGASAPTELVLAGGGFDNTSGSAMTLGQNVTGSWTGTFTFAGSNSLNMGTGAVTLGANTILNVSANTLTVGGVISDGTGTFSLTKGGAGTLLLTGSNTYKGGTTVTGGGTLVEGVTSALLSTGSVTLGESTGNTSGILQLGNTGAANQTLASLNTAGSGTGNAVVGGNANTSTLTINESSADTFAGTLGGSGTNQNNLAVNVTGSNTLTLTGSNTYTGNTTVSAGTLMVANTVAGGSATGTGSLTVSSGATLGGNGTSSGTGFSIAGTGTATRANVLVGLTSATDTTVGHVLTLAGNTGVSTIADANLTFNLDATSTASNQLNVGGTNIAFGTDAKGSVLFTLNLQNEPAVVPNGTLYTLIAGTGSTSTGVGSSTGQYTGLTLGTTTTVGGATETLITGNNLQLAFGSSLDQTYYGNGSYLVLYQNAGSNIDDIDVVVVPEPGTWALMLGGLAALVFWQRRKRNN